MLRVLLIAETTIECQVLQQKLQDVPGIKIVAVLLTADYNQAVALSHSADVIVTNNVTFANLEAHKPRQRIKAVTHQGIQLVPVADIYYFQAEHKYVTAYHKQGQLLLEDSLNELEKEFINTFVRVHRKTLVAKGYIDSLKKNAFGKYYLSLVGRPESIAVSRRQLSNLRKILLCL